MTRQRIVVVLPVVLLPLLHSRTPNHWQTQSSGERRLAAHTCTSNPGNRFASYRLRR